MSKKKPTEESGSHDETGPDWRHSSGWRVFEGAMDEAAELRPGDTFTFEWNGQTIGTIEEDGTRTGVFKERNEP